MHELAITEQLLAVALDGAERAGSGRITTIHVVLGELTNVEDHAVSFYAGLLGRGTPAEGAALRFRRPPALLRCQTCQYVAAASIPLPQACATCGGAELQLAGGRELYVESIEVDDEDHG